MSSYYSTLSANEKVYGPLEKKTFRNVLSQFFTTEFPQIGGTMIIELVIDKIEELIEQYYPKTERLSMGQMLWFGIDENEKTAYQKSMNKLKIKPIILNLVTDSDIQAFKKNVSLKLIKMNLIARLYQEAKEQGAVLAESDLSVILHQCLATISKRTLDYEEQYQIILPRRGTIHDLGRSVSHKKLICKKRKLEKKSISQISLETNHSSQAVHRYTTDLERIEFCVKKNLSIGDISFVTKLSQSLILEYVDLIDEINNNHVQNDLDNELPF